MPSDALLDPQDPWETPPIEIDPELIETSQRLTSLSKAVYGDGTPDQPLAELKENPHLAALEARKIFV
jgi:hypothetical protein